MSVQTAPAPISVSAPAKASAAPAPAPTRVAGTSATLAVPAEPAAPGVDTVALALCLRQGTLMLGFAACFMGMLAARWAERTWVMAAFCGCLAALVSASLGTILARIFLEQVAESQESAAAERARVSAPDK